MGEAKRKRLAREKAMNLAEEILAGFTPAPNKECGGCTACCSVVPVKELGLGSWQRCPHLGDGCCSIYERRPVSCAVWSCGWRVNPDWEDDLRPDRCGFIVDPMEDLAWVNGQETPAVRIWVLPGFEGAWEHDPGKAVIFAIIRGAGAPLVLWDMPPGADGVRRAIPFHRTPEGEVARGPDSEVTKTAMGVGERAWRAAQLAR